MVGRKPNRNGDRRKLAPAEARKVGRPVAKRRARAEPVIDQDQLDLCRQGKHPVSRRLGKGCAACGSTNAWK